MLTVGQHAEKKEIKYEKNIYRLLSIDIYLPFLSQTTIEVSIGYKKSNQDLSMGL
jgi:hypothetical protein